MFVTSCAGCVEILLLFNRADAGLRHAIVIATKPHFRVTNSLNLLTTMRGLVVITIA